VKISFRNPLIRTLTALFLCEVGLFWLSAAMLAQPVSAQQSATQLSEKAMRQIQLIQQEKESRSPAQQKIDSQMLYEMKKRSGRMPKGMPALQTGIKPDQSGKVSVDIKAKVTDELLRQIESAGGEVVYSSEEGGSIRARLPMTQMETLAGNKDVNFIGPAVQGETQKSISRAEGVSQSKTLSLASGGFLKPDAPSSQRLPGVMTKLAQVKIADSGGAVTNTESVNSQGDAAHGADLARSQFGATGKGVKIGVLSDSYNCKGGAQTDISSGDLPADGVNVIKEQDCANPDPAIGSKTDEGRAMLQIIHDLAPDSELYFATAVPTPDSFAHNIRALRDAGCNVIVDDAFFGNESPFQDDVISQAVSEVVKDKVIYFSAAGNNGNLKKDLAATDATKEFAATWEGDFKLGQNIPLEGVPYAIHNFNSNGLNVFNPLLTIPDNTAYLFWSDPLEAPTNDYDLFVFRSDGTIKSRANNIQNGSKGQTPYESLERQVIASGDSLVIAQKEGAEDRYLHLNLFLGGSAGKLGFVTNGSTKGHQTVEGAFGVAATNVAAAAGGRFTGGDANPVEDFSSDGPRRVFYNPDGTPITPGDLLSTGGTVRNQPSLTAADRVSTTVPGFETFPGTSAAAPHAAAIAALLKSSNPDLGPDEIRTALTSTALDIEDPGADINSGAGIIDALQALTFVSEHKPH
jgi:Subtilase family